MVESKATVSMMTCPDVAQPIGPYSLGKIVEMPNGGGKWGYSSGQIGMDPNGNLVGETAAEQAVQAL